MLRDAAYSDGDTVLCGAWSGEAGNARAGVVLFGDVWGMSEALKRRTLQVAALGYLALAADLYGNGLLAASLPEARDAAAALGADERVLFRRADAALETLRGALPEDAPLFAIGYCFGGGVVLDLARRGADLAAVASFHGGLAPRTQARAHDVRAAVLALVGGADPMIPAAQVAAFQEEMRAAAADWQVIIYGRAGHAFAVPGSQAWNLPGVGHDPAADRRSWRAMTMFFEDVLTERAAQRRKQT